jgi:acyl-CoA thioester hydrolase
MQMNRVKVDVPVSLSFKTHLTIRITDINYGNHAGNQVFMELLHEARVRFLKQFNYQELNMEGASLIMADAAMEFNAELLYGDEVEIEVGAAAFSRVGFDLFYRITALRNDTQFLACKAKTGIVCYDYVLKKVVALPENAKKKLIAVDIPEVGQ